MQAWFANAEQKGIVFESVGYPYAIYPVTPFSLYTMGPDNRDALLYGLFAIDGDLGASINSFLNAPVSRYFPQSSGEEEDSGENSGPVVSVYQNAITLSAMVQPLLHVMVFGHHEVLRPLLAEHGRDMLNRSKVPLTPAQQVEWNSIVAQTNTGVVRKYMVEENDFAFVLDQAKTALS